MEAVRTTIDIPEDLHRVARALANDRSETLSETVVALIRRGLGTDRPPGVEIDDQSGLPTLRLGRIITTENVRAVDDP